MHVGKRYMVIQGKQMELYNLLIFCKLLNSLGQNMVTICHYDVVGWGMGDVNILGLFNP